MVHRRGSREVLQLVKGAPEQVFEKCTKIFVNNETVEITENHKKEFLAANLGFAQLGERVLGLAETNMDPEK
jgi:magnesium-transporting ATPase (P-type)